MPSIARVRSNLTGLVRGGGLSTHYFSSVDGEFEPNDTVNLVIDFWAAMRAPLSSELFVQVDPVVDVIDDVTGDLVRSVASAPTANLPGSALAGPLPPANQGLVRLRTQTIVAGRRLMGKFYVPGITLDQVDATEGPSPGIRTAMEAACNGLIASSTTTPWVVWSRKNGVSAPITSADAWGSFAVLRSRRD